MNEHEIIGETPEQQLNGDAATSATAREPETTDSGESRLSSESATSAERSPRESESEAQAAGSAESEGLREAHSSPDDGEVEPSADASTLPDSGAAAEEPLVQAEVPLAPRPTENTSGEPSHGDEPETTQRRVVLQAGTDEESLKALALCKEKVAQLRLRMHPLAARWETDRHVIIFFRADDKVDFRKLVRELSHLLHARIELRQVGPREQGKLCGLVGKCGYPLCCQTFLTQFAQSTIKMAKTQELALNPMKISGVCGRLLCCLNYEQEMYLEAKTRMPRVNKTVDTEFGPGRVVAVNVLKQTVTVQLETTTRELRADQIRPLESQA